MKNSSKRTISRIVAFVMLVSCMFSNIITASADPADLLADAVASGSAVTASVDATTYSLDATTLTAAADKEALAQSEVDSYFTIVGNITKRTSSSGSVSSMELAKNDGGQIQFTIANDGSSVSYDVSSTGSTNTSAYALLDGSGNQIAAGSGEVTGSANGRTTVTVTDLAAGTYTITSPNAGFGRGTRVYKVTVVDGGSADVPVEETTTVETTVAVEETSEETTAAVEETTLAETSVEEVSVEDTTAAVATPPIADLPVGDPVNFEFWLDDVAVDVETTGADGTVSTVKTVEPGNYDFGGSRVALIGNGETKYTPEWAQGVGITRAGKTVNAYKAGKRHATANDIPTVPVAGDGTAIEFIPAATGTFVAYIATTSFLRVWDFDAATGERYGYTDSASSPESVAFKAEPGHIYVLSTTGKTNNMTYAGFEYIIDEPITVNTSYNNVSANPDSLATLEVSLTDANLGTVEAVVKQDTTNVTLAKGHTYVLSTNDGGVKATVNGSDTIKVTDETPIVIDLDDIPDVTLTGEITGTPEGTVTKVQFVNVISGVTVDATITGTTYSATMKPGNYNTVVETTNGGITKDRVKVEAGVENVNEVYVEVPAESGAKTYAPDEIATLPITGTASSRGNDFTGKPGATVTVPVTGAAKVTVNAYYAAEFDINGTPCSVTSGSTSQIDSFTVNATGDVVITFGGAGTSYLTSIEVTPAQSFVPSINVPGDYDTLKDAVSAIKGMIDRPEGEAGRVTINLTADMQEQIVFDAPYITLNGNNHEINWYYGVGTFYYSIDPATGLYNETLARDKYSCAEGNGSLWGGVAIIRGDNFIAENTTFRNTYNYELTDREIPDIDHTAAGIPERVAGTDVTQYKSKERSNAFYIEADNIEVYNCKILSSQDTLGRNGSANNGYHTYFKNCVIGGNTDYICGEFSAVFDNCELQWKTFANDPANNAKVGYIVAPKTSPYVFRNCTVTTDGANGEDPVLGLYGRTWGANSNCSFINTETNGMIKTDGWGEMNVGDAATATFYEYNNTVNGCYGFVYSTNATATGAAVVADYIDTDTQTAKDTVLAGWSPVHYEFVPFEESTGTTESTTESTTQAPAGKDSWIAKDDPALAGDPVTFAGGQKIFTGDRFDLVAGDGGAVSGDVTITNEDFTTTVIGKFVKDTSTDAAGREMINCSAFGGKESAKVRVVATAKSKCDGTLIVNLKANGGKEIVFFDADTKECLHYEMVAETTDPYTVTLPIAVGQNISMGGIGTSPWFYDVTVSNEIPAGTDAWVAKDDPALAADATPITFNGGQTIFESERLTLKAGDGGAVSGDVTITNEDFTTSVVGKYVKDTSIDAAGREMINCSAFGGKDSAKVRVFATAEAGVDGNLVVTLKANGGKELVLFDAETKECLYYQMVAETTDPFTITLPVTAGKKVSIGGIGTSPWFYSVAVSNETEEPTESTTETPTEATTEASSEATTETPTEATTAADVAGWVAKDDPALAGGEVVFAGGDVLYTDNNVDLIIGAGGAKSGNVEITNPDFTTEVVGKWVKDTSTDDAGREFIDCSLYGGKTSDKVRVAFEAKAKIDGTLTVTLKANAGKALVLFDTDTKECVFYDMPAETTDPYEIKVPVKAGQSISVGAVGSSPWMYSAKVTDEVLPTPDYPMGDVNHDTKVTALDSALTVQYVLNNSKKIFTENADVSGNGIIDSEDAAMILQKSLDSSYLFFGETTEATTEATTVAPVDPITVYVVGDSTGCHYADTEDANYYYKRVGFGDGLPNYLREEATVVNLAMSGRSSKSFLSEANYTTLKNSIKAGDVLLIAFGHNDEKADDTTRYTFPSTDANPTTKDTEGSFKNSLYVNYIKLAQDAGATPIVCSPIVRRTTGDSWSDNQLHKANGGDYAADAKAVAEECGVPFIDLTGITQAKYTEMTPAKTVNMHAWTNSKDTSVDNTHLNAYGAKEVAYLIATNAPEVLVPYVKAGIAEPTTADLVVNPDYVEATNEDLTAEELPSKLWTTTSPWYGTVFGDIGGNDKLTLVLTMADGSTLISDKLADKNNDGVTNFVINENADGSVRVKAGDGEGNEIVDGCTFGKIAGTSDGLAMYYQPVDVQQNFSISGTITVNSFGLDKNGQNSFGAIVADKVEVDKYDKIMIPNYVAAGPLKVTKDATTGEIGGAAWAGFARIGDVLTQGTTTLDVATELPKAGDVVDVKITKVGSHYTLQYGNKTTEFDVEMTGTVYVGFYAARCADITISNINYNNEVTE